MPKIVFYFSTKYIFTRTSVCFILFIQDVFAKRITKRGAFMEQKKQELIQLILKIENPKLLDFLYHYIKDFIKRHS